MSGIVSLRRANSEGEYAIAEKLFKQYADQLGFSLCFQNFEDELRSLAKLYGPPRGVLLLATLDSENVGCVALKDHGDKVAEMKRLYVVSAARGHGIGRKLAVEIMAEATRLGYLRVRLDTISDKMPEAISLYRSLGFREIAAYYDNPLEGALYMQCEMDSDHPLAVVA